MRWIYISPHLDDAALSAGGFIFDQIQAGNPVEIWTIVCGYPTPGELTPLAQMLHQQWGTQTAEDTVRLRRAEDLKAAALLRATTVHFDVPDCIYRRGKDGEPFYLDVFVQPHETEAGLPAQIAQTVSARLQPGDQIICQLGIGGHVDHVLVRQAAELLGYPLWYAADLPYLFNQPGELVLKTVGMKESLRPITEAGLIAWVEAVLTYESQLSTLFEDLETIGKNFSSYYSERGGFSLWKIE